MLARVTSSRYYCTTRHAPGIRWPSLGPKAWSKATYRQFRIAAVRRTAFLNYQVPGIFFRTVPYHCFVGFVSFNFSVLDFFCPSIFLVTLFSGFSKKQIRFLFSFLWNYLLFFLRMQSSCFRLLPVRVASPCLVFCGRASSNKNAAPSMI